MKRLRFRLSYLVISLLTFSFISCVSSETIEPESPVEKSDEIVLSLSSPAELKSRGEHDGFYLRYVAKLFEVNNGTTPDYSTLQRAELIEGKENNKITFKVNKNEQQKYGIMVFADYIKDDTPDNNNEYKDYYYDTHNSVKNVNSDFKDIIVMYTTPMSSSNTLAAEFFNNDNYDCFSFYSINTKEAGKKLEIKCELTRAVAKVKLIDNSDDPGTLSNLKIDNLKFFNSYNQRVATKVNNTSFTNKSFDVSELLSLKEEENEGKTIFFFYTFSSEYGTAEYINLGFTTEIKEKPISLSIPVIENRIRVVQNYITKVRGTLLPQLSVSNDDKGDIILNVSTAQDWGNDKKFDYDIEKDFN